MKDLKTLKLNYMNVEAITQMIQEIIAYDLDLGIDPGDINENSSLQDGDLALDSISIIQLITLIEKKFAIGFDEDEITLDLFANVKILSELIHSKVNTRVSI